MIWDLHESDAADRGTILSLLKGKLIEQLLAVRGRAASIVDEAVTVTEAELGARTLSALPGYRDNPTCPMGLTMSWSA